MTDYDHRQHSVYREGRALSEHTASVWMDAVARHASDARTLLDVGCGIGRFSPLLADHLHARVLGVDRSRRMLSVAAEHAAHARVVYAAADAAAIPARDDAFDAALLSCVVHHLPDRDAAAGQIARAIRPGGRVLVRQAFAGRLDGAVYLRFFPTALAIAERTMPSVEDICGAFGRAGVEFVTLETVHQQTDATPKAYADRISHRAISLLEDISDAEFERGLAELREESDAAPAEPVVEWLDLLVLQKP